MADRRDRTAKLNKRRFLYVRVLYGLICGILVFQCVMDLGHPDTGHVVVAALRAVAAGIFGWYAIRPPKLLRERFIED